MQIPGAHGPDSLAYWPALSQWGFSQKARWESSVVARAFHPSTQEAKAVRSQFKVYRESARIARATQRKPGLKENGNFRGGRARKMDDA